MATLSSFLEEPGPRQTFMSNDIELEDFSSRRRAAYSDDGTTDVGSTFTSRQDGAIGLWAWISAAL